MTLYEIHRLAQEIEVIHAKDLARRIGGRFGKNWQQYYDAHAATELGELLYARIRQRKPPLRAPAPEITNG